MNRLSSLTIRAQADVTFEAEVDLVKFFTTLDARAKRSYYACNLQELGFSDEFERPMAYLMSELEDSIEGFRFGPESGVQVDQFSGAAQWNRGLEVAQRDGRPSLYGQDREWSAEDYENLLQQVPWMRPEVKDEVMVHPGQGVLPL